MNMIGNWKLNPAKKDQRIRMSVACEQMIEGGTPLQVDERKAMVYFYSFHSVGYRIPYFKSQRGIFQFNVRKSFLRVGN